MTSPSLALESSWIFSAPIPWPLLALFFRRILFSHRLLSSCRNCKRAGRSETASWAGWVVYGRTAYSSGESSRRDRASAPLYAESGRALHPSGHLDWPRTRRDCAQSGGRLVQYVAARDRLCALQRLVIGGSDPGHPGRSISTYD